MRAVSGSLGKGEKNRKRTSAFWIRAKELNLHFRFPDNFAVCAHLHEEHSVICPYLGGAKTLCCHYTSPAYKNGKSRLLQPMRVSVWLIPTYPDLPF